MIIAGYSVGHHVGGVANFCKGDEREEHLVSRETGKVRKIYK